MTLKRTPLYDTHIALGGRMVEFGGWEMPVQYSSILQEHHAVRQTAGLFDICHMGEVRVEGPGAWAFLQATLTNGFSDLPVGAARYTLMCNDRGGTIDDLIVYRTAPQAYLLVVNASNTDKDFDWLARHRRDDMTLENISDQTGLLALQGPKAEAILQPLTKTSLARVPYYHCIEGQVADIDGLLARTGYTGEDGFELMVAADAVASLWDRIMEVGQGEGLLPTGLGARDTLRLEAAMPLYGHELDEETTPLEAGLGRFVDLDKGDFIGRAALAQVKEQGLTRRLAGFRMVGRGIAREGYEIAHNGSVVGQVTSGTHSPTLGMPIGMGYVSPELSTPGTAIDVIVRGRPVPAEVVRRPFYSRKRR